MLLPKAFYKLFNSTFIVEHMFFFFFSFYLFINIGTVVPDFWSSSWFFEKFSSMAAKRKCEWHLLLQKIKIVLFAKKNCKIYNFVDKTELKKKIKFIHKKINFQFRK